MRRTRWKQITVRGFDEPLERRIRDVAESEGISLNQAVLRLLRRGAGLEPGRRDVIGDARDHLLGTWTEDDEREFEEAIGWCKRIDEDSWK